MDYWLDQCFGLGGLLSSQIIVGIISFKNPVGRLGLQRQIGVLTAHKDYSPQRWHQFLLYIGYTVAAFCINAFGNQILPWVTKGAFAWSISGFIVISITLLACASPEYSSGDFVFRGFVNETGWPDGVAWLLGLLQAGLGLTGYDAVAHMIEEIPDPTVEGPRIMVACVGIGTFTGFIFLMVLLFVAGPIEDVIGFPLICILFATITIMTTSSRMTWAFARDGGLPLSRVFAKVHPTLELPLNSLILTTSLVIVFGCIFLGSDSAFNAIVSASVVALGVSYAMPVAINCLRGRKMLRSRPFTLPGWFGWFANLLGIAYIIVTTVFFLFPPELPVTGSNMNYCIVVFAIIILISTFQWFVDGRKNFKGPRVDLEVVQQVDSHARATANVNGDDGGDDHRYSDQAGTA
ncbi:MAG: hypothetical protein LQ346_005778 [Caloplaca aetnensis]|nr:MAG: hypothetical protein LQ346_005778 [Caloplaca aetnensis]